EGPGLATSFGGMWNDMLSGQGVALGASYAVLGFVFGGTIGVLLINIFSRRRKVEKIKQYEDTLFQTHVIKVDTIEEINIMDGITVQFVVISIIYSLVWLTLYLLEMVLYSGTGGIGDTVFGLLKGFNFILGIFYAMLYKFIVNKIEQKGKNVNFITNDYVLSNFSSLFFNIMICGAVLTITIDFFEEFGWIFLIVSFVVGLSTLFYVRFITQRVYPKFKDEYFVGLFGMLTGTASTGIALLKGLDKNLESPVAEEMVLGSGTAIAMALPLFAILMLPSLGYGKPNEVLFNYIALFGCLLYVLIMVTILLVRSRKKSTE
ncbi:MAG: hypothetical protein KAH13_01640, partial [Tenericutes bacterium]|nr:hypothetical protein [Mycoplasmatota bacterium]